METHSTQMTRHGAGGAGGAATGPQLLNHAGMGVFIEDLAFWNELYTKGESNVVSVVSVPD